MTATEVVKTDLNYICSTNKAELEPSAKYGAKQILAFLKEVAERRSIVSPSRF